MKNAAKKGDDRFDKFFEVKRLTQKTLSIIRLFKKELI